MMGYCEEADIQKFFGTEQVTDWADKDLNGSADTGVVTYHIAVNDDYLDRRFRRSRYQVPLQKPTSTDPPDAIKYLSARLSGYSLFLHWGLGSDKAERMAQVKAECEREIEMILSGEILLDAKEN